MILFSFACRGNRTLPPLLRILAVLTVPTRICSIQARTTRIKYSTLIRSVNSSMGGSQPCCYRILSKLEAGKLGINYNKRRKSATEETCTAELVRQDATLPDALSVNAALMRFGGGNAHPQH